MLCVSMPLLCSRTRRRGGEEKSTTGLLCKVHSPLSWERHSPLARAVLPRGSLSAGPVRVRRRSSVGCRFLTSFYSAITLRVIASIKLERYTVWTGRGGVVECGLSCVFPLRVLGGGEYACSAVLGEWRVCAHSIVHAQSTMSH